MLWRLAQPILSVVGQGSGSYCVDCPRALGQLDVVHTVLFSSTTPHQHTSTLPRSQYLAHPAAAPAPAPALLQPSCPGPTGPRDHWTPIPGMLPCHPGGEAINARPVLPFQGRLAEPFACCLQRQLALPRHLLRGNNTAQSTVEDVRRAYSTGNYWCNCLPYLSSILYC